MYVLSNGSLFGGEWNRRRPFQFRRLQNVPSRQRDFIRRPRMPSLPGRQVPRPSPRRRIGMQKMQGESCHCCCCCLCCFCFVFSLTPVLPLRLEHFWPTTEAKTHKTNTTMLEIVSIATPKHSAMLDHAIADLVQLVTKRFQAIQTVKRKRNVNHAPRVNTNQILPAARVCLAILEGTNRRAVFHIVCHVYQVNTKMDVASRRAKSVESTQNPIRPPRQSAVIAVLVNFPLAAAPSVLPV